jgi:hypothetical protein
MAPLGEQTGIAAPSGELYNMRTEGWLAQNCRFAGSDPLVNKALTSVMSWKVSLGKEKFAEALQEAGMTIEQFNGMLRPLLVIQSVPAEFRYIFVDLIEEPWQILQPRTIQELKTATAILGSQGTKTQVSQDDVLIALAKMPEGEDRLLEALKAYKGPLPNALMTRIYGILMADMRNRPSNWTTFKSILLLRWDLAQALLRNDPKLFVDGFFVYSWAFNPNEFSPDVLSVLLQAMASMHLSSIGQANEIMRFLSKVGNLFDMAKATYDALVRGDPAMRNNAIQMALSNTHSSLELPETREYIESQIRTIPSNPSALVDLVSEMGDITEERMRRFGVKLPDMVPIYEEALAKFFAAKKRLAESFHMGVVKDADDDFEAGSEMMKMFSSTESSRKALRFFADGAQSPADMPGLKSVFYLRADLLSQQEMYDSFLYSWKISARTNNAQAIQLVLNDDPRTRGQYPVEPFFDSHTPLHFEEEVGPDGKTMAGEHIIRSLTTQQSYDAMKKTFEDIYRKTQSTLVKDILARDKYAEEILVKDNEGKYAGLNLMRGVSSSYNVPSSLESWTSDGFVAHHKFDGHAVWLAPIPLRAVLISFASPHWGKDFGPRTMECEYEYIVIRSFVGPQNITKNVFGDEEREGR